MNKADDSYEIYDAGVFELQRGGVLPNARLAYKTYGILNPARDNAILFPTWFSATHRNNEWIIGADKALDPSRYFIIVANLLGNGLSSSPSNTDAPFGGPSFPSVTVLDNVRLQHKLITERLGINRLALVLGRSMGAQTAFQWASYFPEAVMRVLPFCGSAKTTPHNYVFLEGVKAALTTDCAWNGGHYETQPWNGLQAVGRLYAGWVLSQSYYRQRMFVAEGARNIAEYMEQRWDKAFFHCDANDMLAMLGTWQSADISDNDRFAGDWPAALRAIKCPAIVMPSRTDLYFPPEDSASAVRHMQDAELRVIESVWGHRAGSPKSDPADIRFIDDAIRELLSR